MQAGPSDISSWHQDSYRIYNKDIDFRHELRLSSVLGMLQESAWNHAKLLEVDYSQEAFRSVYWVLSRLQLAMVAEPPQWMETAKIATSPTGLDKLFALRDFVGLRDNGMIYVKATSSWVIIDSASRRLQRPEAYISELSHHFSHSIMPSAAPKLTPLSLYDWKQGFSPEYSHIDSHQHVNNVSYVEFCLDTLGEPFFDTHTLATLSVNFLSELAWGEKIRVGVHIEEKKDTLTQFVIQKTSDGSNAALLDLRWSERGQKRGK